MENAQILFVDALNAANDLKDMISDKYIADLLDLLTENALHLEKIQREMQEIDWEMFGEEDADDPTNMDTVVSLLVSYADSLLKKREDFMKCFYVEDAELIMEMMEEIRNA